MSKEEEYKQIFQAEALDNLEELNRLFADLENNPENKQAVDAIFRITHTMKGNALGMGFKEIGEMSHIMEDVFGEVRAGKLALHPDSLNTLFKGLDKLSALVAALDSGKEVKYKLAKNRISKLIGGEETKDEPQSTVSEDNQTPVPEPEEVSSIEVEEKNIEKPSSEASQEIANNESKEEEVKEETGGEEVKAEYKELFYTEATENQEELNKLFADLEKNKKDSNAINAIFRITHTLKGNALGMGYKEVAKMAHALEDVFGAIREDGLEVTDEVFADLYRGLDTLTSLIDAIKTGKKVKYLGVKAKMGVILRKHKESKGEEESSKEELQTEESNEVVAPPAAEEVKEVVEEEEEEEEEEDTEAPKIVFSDLVQVPVKKLDGLMNLVGELVIERDRLIAEYEALQGKKGNFGRLVRITSDLQFSVMDVRLVQVSFLFNKFHRVVRDAAATEKKRVKLELKGTETEIDRNVLSIISDSMIHLVRNSVGHGIELPEDRKKAGKDETGTVTLNARNENDNVIIEISDNGKGIDPKVIGKKAIEKGLASEDSIERMSDKDIIQYIFEPGFSSMDTVTAISGRGVGMDVVKRSIDSIGGSIDLASEVGKGSTIKLVLPSSMAVKGTLLFQLQGQEYAIPLSYTEAVVSFTKADIHKVSKGLIATYLDKTISVIFLKDIFESADGKITKDQMHNSFNSLKGDEQLDVVIVSSGGKSIGFVVDKLLQQKEIVEKPLMKPVNNVPYIGGVTILGTGKVCLVINVMSIVESVFNLNRG